MMLKWKPNLDVLKRWKYIATNLAGRGLDILEEVLKKGGMHISLTFLPINIRVQEQAFGRSGRKGEPGTWQLVLNILKAYPEEYINNFIRYDR